MAQWRDSRVFDACNALPAVDVLGHFAVFDISDSVLPNRSLKNLCLLAQAYLGLYDPQVKWIKSSYGAAHVW